MSLWFVWRPLGEDVFPVLGGSEPRPRTDAAVKIIEADTEREAAAQYGCNVLDLREGFDLLVAPVPEEASGFHRVYSVQGDPSVYLGVDKPVVLDKGRHKVDNYLRVPGEGQYRCP